MQKVEAIVAEHPSVSLDDLVASRKINTDQKTQILKKPQLQAQLAQLEESMSLHKKIEDDVNRRIQAQKDRLEAEHKKELEDAKASATEVAQDLDKANSKAKLLLLSKFLRAAAARRQDSDESTDESKGFEGVLLYLYGGDSAAVDTAEKLIEGSTDPVVSTEGIPLGVSYERVKALSLEYAPFATEEAWVNGVADASQEPAPDPTAPNTDPTITNASLTEMSATTEEQPTLANTTTFETGMPGPEQITVSDAANEAADEQWGKSKPAVEQTANADPMAESWVSVPRPAEETEQHNAGASAGVATNQTENWADIPAPAQQESWADASAESWGATPATSTQANEPRSAAGDGFHEVHHGRGRGRGSYGGEHRGRGRGGFRGDRGRGGGFRGDRGRGFEGRGRNRGRGSRDAGPPPA